VILVFSVYFDSAPHFRLLNSFFVLLI